MLLEPKKYFNKIQEINIEFLRENEIKALILDMDNTLINYKKQMPKQIEDWAKELIKQGIKLFIVSNSNDSKKVQEIAKRLNVEFTYFAMKPLSFGLKKAQKKLKEQPKNIAVVGDQIFTDVLGGNICKMYTILIDAMEEKDYWYTAWKRPIENKMKNKFKETNKGENK